MEKLRKPYRIKKKKPFFRNKFFWIFISSITAAIFIVYVLFFLSFFQIKEFIFLNEFDKNNEIRNLITEENKKSIFLFDEEKMEKYLLEKYIILENAHINRKFPDKILIDLKLREGIAIFISEDNAFLMDKDGIIFKKAEANNLFKIKTVNNHSFNLGERVINEELETILYLKSELEENLKIPLEEMAITENRINVKTKQGWDIYFSLRKDLDLQITELGLVLEKKISPDERGNLQYIDLRFEKIYYK